MSDDIGSSDAAVGSHAKPFGAHVQAHARGLIAVTIASAVGILATFLFQVVSARYLAPADFGLFSAFLVIVNVAAIGSSALQNLITVQTAATLRDPSGGGTGKSRWPIDAMLLGLVGGAAVAALSPLVANALGATVALMLAAALTIPLTFLTADSLGLLQGAGRVAGAVWWSTAAQVTRVVCVGVVIVVGAGLAGVAVTVVIATAAATIGAAWSSRRIHRPHQRAFSTTGATILVLTVAFAWLISADVFFVRAGAPESLAGVYAAVTVLVKASFLLPSTLALYLLPRFVRNRDNPSLTRAGVLATLGVSFATGLVMIAFFAIFGAWLIALLYGPAYAGASALLVPAAVAYLPWMAAQGLLVKMTASASKAAAAVLLIAVAAQWLAFALTIPDLIAMLVAMGVIGTAILTVFVLIEWLVLSPRSGTTKERATAT